MPDAKNRNEGMHNETRETMKAMMTKMSNMHQTGNTDKNFVMMMIPRHEQWTVFRTISIAVPGL